MNMDISIVGCQLKASVVEPEKVAVVFMFVMLKAIGLTW